MHIYSNQLNQVLSLYISYQPIVRNNTYILVGLASKNTHDIQPSRDLKRREFVESPQDECDQCSLAMADTVANRVR